MEDGLDLRPLGNYESRCYMEYNHYVITGIVNLKNMKRTKRFSVVCKTIDRAIAICHKDYPDFEIQSIAHQGQIEKVEL